MNSETNAEKQEGVESVELSRTQIEQYLREVGVEVQTQGLTAEILIVGGAS